MTSTCSAEVKSRARPPVHKKFLRAVALLSSGMILWAAAGFFVLVRPATDAAERADVLFVLAPAGDRRWQAEQLMDQGAAGTLVFSIPQGQPGNPDPDICYERRAYRIICFSPDPVTTQGEARALSRLSRENGWKSANVLTMQSHITRARSIIRHCYKDDLRMIAYWQKLPVLSFSNPKRSWAYRFVYETAAFVKSAFNQSC